MAFVHCPNGHIYDNLKYKECPFCLSSDNSDLAAKQATELPETSFNDQTELSDMADKTLLDDDEQVFAQPSNPAETQKAQNPDGHTVVMEYDAEEEIAPKSGSGKNLPRRIEGFLVTYDFNKYGNFYPLYLGKNSIGRQSTNDIVLNDPSISNEHALILFRGNQILIEDKLSVNGTFLNNSEESIDRGTLKDNDLIRFGKKTFKIKIVGEINAI